MKLIFMVIALLSSACSGENREVASEIKSEDGMQFIIFQNGREVGRKTLTFDSKDEEFINSWLESFAGLSGKDFNSYAPVAILLGKKIKVNFQRDVTVISVKEKDEPTAVWNQYSRVPTKQDREAEKLLRKLKEKRGGE